VDDEAVVLAAAREALAAFPAAVADYRAGKTAALGRLIGETIKRTGGRAKPDQVRRVLESELSGTPLGSAGPGQT
jgi:aspartyl-tRNA(Asn)/glutamyl-tRNA(Gln) amidotransferase subunit B